MSYEIPNFKYPVHGSSRRTAAGLEIYYTGTSRSAAAVPFGRRRSRAPYDVCWPEKTTSIPRYVIVKKIKTVSPRSYSHTKTMNDRNWTSCGTDVGTYILGTHYYIYYIVNGFDLFTCWNVGYTYACPRTHDAYNII